MATDTRPVFDTSGKYQITAQDEGAEANSFLHERFGDGEFIISLV
jgi:hypothetical protein